MQIHHRLPILASLVLVSSLAAQVLPRVTPEEVGLSSERLARIDAVVKDHVDNKEISGVVTLVARHGKIAHFAAYGSADIEEGKPMKEDTIFRIASMTKPITSTAVMMLYEEGKFLLSDPVGKYIPEFQNQVVLPGPDATNNYRVPAKRPMTIRNLLTHTSGLTYGDHGLRDMYLAYGISSGLGPCDLTIGEMVRRLGKLPLAFHPGERYNYGLSVDVQGALVEVWSGMTLAEFFEQRLTGPLDMEDTHFYLPPEKVGRLAKVYQRQADQPIEPSPEVRGGEGGTTTSYPYKGAKKLYAGGAGLCSTVMDYARFAQMMLNGGELGGKRFLSPTTVRLMTMDHAGKIVADGSAPSFGLGFYVDSADRGFTELTSEGTHGWGGYWYTTFFISPEEEMIGVAMAQLQPSGGLRLNDKFKVLAHQAIID